MNEAIDRMVEMHDEWKGPNSNCSKNWCWFDSFEEVGEMGGSRRFEDGKMSGK